MSPRSLRLALALPAVAAGVALSAAAWSPSPDGADADVSLSAVDNARVEASFASADTSGDGQLTRQEAQSVPAVAGRFEALDRDRDGRLSLEEFAAAYLTPG